MKALTATAAAVLLGIGLIGCSSKAAPEDDTPTAIETEAETETEAPESPEATENEAGAPIITAPVNSIAEGFDPVVLDVPADQAFTLTFNNDDTGIPHNVQIFEGDEATGPILWAPDDNATINGVASVDYEIPALEEGTYAFNCYVHPAMVGTITAA